MIGRIIRSPWFIVPAVVLLAAAFLTTFVRFYFAPRDIFEAARQGDLERVQKYLDNGVSIDASDEAGFTPLHYAARGPETDFGGLTFVERLRAEMKQSVAANQHGEVFDFLVEAGANLDSKDRRGRTLLVSAIRSGRLFQAEALLKAGADPNLSDHEGSYPIATSIPNGLFAPDRVPRALRLLLEHGADPNVRDALGNTVLHHQVSLSEPILEALLDRGFEINAQNDAGDTLLHLAARRRDREDTAMLLAHGADPELKNNDGLTAAELSSRRGRGPANPIRE